jgi:L-rhamnose mutarotase
LLALLLAAGCAAAHKAQQASPQKQPQRFGMVIGLKPEKLADYRELHANAWPGVLEMITACNIRNYSIYMQELEPGKFYLFSYFEYVGDDFEADMKRMAADAETQRWWKETDPCQQKIMTAAEGEWWSMMEEVFHHD